MPGQDFASRCKFCIHPIDVLQESMVSNKYLLFCFKGDHIFEALKNCKTKEFKEDGFCWNKAFRFNGLTADNYHFAQEAAAQTTTYFQNYRPASEM